jgi:hypothetical protein
VCCLGGRQQFDGASSASYIPQISLGVDLFNKKTDGKFKVRGELSFSDIKPRFTAMVPTGFFNVPTAQSYTFNQYTIALTPQVIYNFYRTNDCMLYAGLGISANYSFYSNNTTTITSIKPYDFEKVWIAYPLQAGVVIAKRVDIYALYCFPAAYNEASSFSISNTVYGLGLHYHIGK